MILIKTTATALGFALVALQAAFAAQGGSGKKDTESDKGKAAVEAWIDRAVASEAPKDAPPLRVPRKVQALDNEHVRKAFAEDRFYSVHAKKMPRPDMVPRALRAVKLVRVRPDGSVERIDNVEALKSLLCARFSGVRDEALARTALMTTLRLAEEYYQDGTMTFTVPAEATTVSRRGESIVAAGKAVVSQGGEGEVRVSLLFGPSGSLKPDGIKISGRVRSDVLLR